MVYGITTNLYELPKVVKIEVTILRGARKLKFSSKLQYQYKDFAPKVWKTLVYFGYKKYLQRIYIDVDIEKKILSPDLQVPIMIEILKAVGIIKLSKPLITAGTFSGNLINPPINIISKSIKKQSIPIKLPRTREKMDNFLKRILLKPWETIDCRHNWNYILKEYFPQCITKEGRIDIIRTPLSILRKTNAEEYGDLPIYIDMQQKPNKSKLEFIRGLPLSNVKFDNKITKITDKNIKDILQINAWRIEEPFELS